MHIPTDFAHFNCFACLLYIHFGRADEYFSHIDGTLCWSSRAESGRGEANLSGSPEEAHKGRQSYEDRNKGLAAQAAYIG